MPGFAHEDPGLIPQSLTGDGLVLGAEIGGIVHKVENSLRVMLSYTIPAETPGGMATSVHAGIVELCSPHTPLVNRYGRRFADETFFQGIVSAPLLILFFEKRVHAFTMALCACSRDDAGRCRGGLSPYLDEFPLPKK